MQLILYYMAWLNKAIQERDFLPLLIQTEPDGLCNKDEEEVEEKG